MRNITATMRAKLDARVSTLCSCWRLTRRDGAVFGFTDHDRDLAFAGVVFRAGSGLSASEMDSNVGFAPGTGEAVGALRSDGLSDADLANGVYDGASVETWLVDWSDVTDRLLVDVATIGEVTRNETTFAAELRSSAHYFDQPRGQDFQRACSADLGDARCGFDLSTPGFHGSGVVGSFEGGVVVAELGASFDGGLFTGGRLSFVSGANAGAAFDVKSHRRDGAVASIALWTSPSGLVAAGDAFNVVAGCDKSMSACRTKFANIANFRGFPHMPGNDRVIAYPSALAPAMDGGSFFK